MTDKGHNWLILKVLMINNRSFNKLSQEGLILRHGQVYTPSMPLWGVYWFHHFYILLVDLRSLMTKSEKSQLNSKYRSAKCGCNKVKIKTIV